MVQHAYRSVIGINTRVVLAVVGPPPPATLAIRAAAMTVVDDAAKGVGAVLGVVDEAGVGLYPKQDTSRVARRIREHGPVAAGILVPIPPLEHDPTIVQIPVVGALLATKRRPRTPELVLHWRLVVISAKEKKECGVVGKKESEGK